MIRAPQAAAWVILAAYALGCESPKEADPAPEVKSKSAKAEAAPPAPATLAGWKRYENPEAGFSVLGPTDKPTEGTDTSTEGIAARMWQFPFGNAGLGQVMVLQYTGKELYNAETGLDGAITNAVSTLSGEMGRFDKEKDAGRIARQFTFAARHEGIALEGTGRGIVTNPTQLIIAIAFWQRGNPSLASDAKRFMDSFSAP